jgi:hypothetical protein
MLNPFVKTINNRPLTGYMLLGLALEYVDCLNRQEPVIVMQCFERVVSIESERFVEQLYDETITSINLKYDFSQREGEEKKQSELDVYKVFEDLEIVYSNQELDNFVENLID